MFSSKNKFFDSDIKALQKSKQEAIISVTKNANQYIETHRNEIKQQGLEAGLTDEQANEMIESVREKLIESSLQDFLQLAREAEERNNIHMPIL